MTTNVTRAQYYYSYFHDKLAISVYKRKTRELTSSLFRRISYIGDTYEQHKENLDYNSFLELQLELVEKITTTERRISKFKKETPKNFQKIKEARERRRLLKLLGSTIAWILLEFDKRYIRYFARGRSPGFISGKKGLELEIRALLTAFELENCAAVLHDITNCLHVGDLSVKIPGDILNFELKLGEGKRKLSARERRQKRKREIIQEFYDRGISTRLIPGKTTRQCFTKKPDQHNWKDISAVIKEAIEKGYGNRIVEDCMIYRAFQNKPTTSHESMDDLIRLGRERFKNPFIMFKCHDNHILGLTPGMMPFTCFDIPLSYKEKLLFEEVGFCVILDLNSLARIIEESGFPCKVVLKDSALEVSHKVRGKIAHLQLGYGPVYRLLLECLSVKSFLDYVKRMLKEIKKDKYWNGD